MPPCLHGFLRHVEELKFQDRPDYDHLREILRERLSFERSAAFPKALLVSETHIDSGTSMQEPLALPSALMRTLDNTTSYASKVVQFPQGKLAGCPIKKRFTTTALLEGVEVVEASKIVRAVGGSQPLLDLAISETLTHAKEEDFKEFSECENDGSKCQIDR